MDIKITNKINLFDLEDFIKKIWKKKFHNTNISYYNCLINQNYSNNKSNILVSYNDNQIIYILCNINLLYSDYKVGSLINFYSIDKTKYNYAGAQLLKTYLDNYDIVFNSSPRKQFKNSLLKNKNWHNVQNYLCKVIYIKNSFSKYTDNNIEINFVKVNSEHINFIRSIKDYKFFDKNLNYYKWKIDNLKFFSKKSINFVEMRVNGKLKSLFLVEIKKNKIFINEYYSNLEDLELSLSYLFYFLKHKNKFSEFYIYFHEMIMDLFKISNFKVIKRNDHFFFFKNKIQNIKNLDLDNFFVFPTDSDEFLYN